LLVLAAESAHLNAFIAVLVVGLAIGVFGHIIHSRTLIITGILVIGLVSAYFSFVLQPSGK
jgi:F0F1-type ATP synthase assembly protein I